MIKELRAVKQTLSDESVVYQIQGLSESGIWVNLVTRESLETATVAVKQLRAKAVVSEEVLDV